MLKYLSKHYLDKIARSYGWTTPVNTVPKETAVKNVPYNFQFSTQPRQTWESRMLPTTPVALGSFPNPDVMRKSYGVPVEAWATYNKSLQDMVPKIKNGKEVVNEKGEPVLIQRSNQLPSDYALNVPKMPHGWTSNPTFNRIPDGVIWAQGRRESDGGLKDNNKASRGMFQPERPIFNRLVQRFPAQMKGITWEGLSKNPAHAHTVRDLTDQLNARDFHARYGRLPTIKESLMMYKEGLNVFQQPEGSPTYQRGRTYVNNIVKDLFYHNPAYAKKVFPELSGFKAVPFVPVKPPAPSRPITNNKTNTTTSPNMYAVKSGDSLGTIVANRGIKGATNIYNMVNKIKKLNSLQNDKIKPGQQLILPEGL